MSGMATLVLCFSSAPPGLTEDLNNTALTPVTADRKQYGYFNQNYTGGAEYRFAVRPCVRPTPAGRGSRPFECRPHGSPTQKPDANHSTAEGAKYWDTSLLIEDKDMTCAPGAFPAGPRRPPFHGVNLGGWLLLEPWLTPSLFYQFLGADERYGKDAPMHTATDMYSFCAVLGPEEGNKQLRRHWRTWVTEDLIRQVKAKGADSLRVPVGDWMVEPYWPFEGCTDGAMDELDRVVDLANDYGLGVLIDVHGVNKSQNGFDNSGRMTIIWDHSRGKIFYEHWLIRDAEWIGHFVSEEGAYDMLDWGNLDRTVESLRLFASACAGGTMDAGRLGARMVAAYVLFLLFPSLTQNDTPTDLPSSASSP